jgi:hypothetical protein
VGQGAGVTAYLRVEQTFRDPADGRHGCGSVSSLVERLILCFRMGQVVRLQLCKSGTSASVWVRDYYSSLELELECEVDARLRVSSAIEIPEWLLRWQERITDVRQVLAETKVE